MEPSNDLNPFGIQEGSQESEEKVNENYDQRQAKPSEPAQDEQKEGSGIKVLNEKKEIDVFEILSISWKKFKQNWKFLVILTLIYLGIRIVEGILQKALQANSLEAIIASILIAAFNGLIAIGMVQIFLKISRGQQAQYGEIFGGSKYFWKLIGASILYILIILAGYLLLIIPGIIWQYKYGMFSYLIIDKGMSPMEAIKESGRLMDGNKWKLFFLQLLMIPVFIAGILALGVGILAAIPVVTLMSVYFYRTISGEEVKA